MADAEQQAVEEQPVQAVGDVQGGEAQGEQQGAPTAAEGPGVESHDPPMTKRQMKKLAKQKRFEEQKARRKAEEKARRQADQERRREEGRARMEGMTEEERAAWRAERDARGVARKEERMASRARMAQALETGQKLVVDLDFVDKMLDTELKSICKQLGYAWHANCAAAVPAHLVLTSMQGKMRECMERQVSGYANWKATITEQPYLEHFAAEKDKLVYLTADSENELTELDPGSIYIVGGIVDRNRHKLLCLNKAQEQGIAHARLPIGGYMQLASSQVMTTNHVVDIMLRWLELRDWKQAFEAVIPPRKRKHGEGEEEGQEQGEGGTEDGAAAEAAEAEAEEQAPKRQAAGDGDAQEQQEQQEAQ